MSNALHPAHQFRNVVESKANDFLQSMVGTENGAAAAGRVALAFRQAAQTNDRLYSCEPASVAQAVALSAMTGLMPGGPLPDVYLLPAWAEPSVASISPRLRKTGREEWCAIANQGSLQR